MSLHCCDVHTACISHACLNACASAVVVTARSICFLRVAQATVLEVAGTKCFGTTGTTPFYVFTRVAWTEAVTTDIVSTHLCLEECVVTMAASSPTLPGCVTARVLGPSSLGPGGPPVGSVSGLRLHSPDRGDPGPSPSCSFLSHPKQHHLTPALHILLWA